MAHDNTQYDVVWLIRRLFRAMAQASDDTLADSGLTAADRAVMEFLYPDERLSVPEIAARYAVSRQHVQVTVNGLLKSGLLRSEPNPRHKRSALLRLSDLGRAAFADIRHNEAAVLDQLFADLDDNAVATTRDTLKQLYAKF